jgi:hypothetical protein
MDVLASELLTYAVQVKASEFYDFPMAVLTVMFIGCHFS